MGFHNYISLLPISTFNNMLKFCIIIGISACLVAAIPKPQEDDYEEEICLTAKDSVDPEKECVFPFTHNNITYNGCPTDPDDETKRWCSTKTDENGVHVKESWGYCTKGYKPEITPDDLTIGTEADKDTQTDTCDFSACNGFTLKTTVFENEITFGQCQFPFKGTEEDFFCFVNANSACEDKVLFGGEEDSLYVTKLGCKDPKAPLPRLIFGFGGFGGGFSFSSRRSSSRGRSRSSSFSFGFGGGLFGIFGR